MLKRSPAAQTALGPMVVVAIEQTYPARQRIVQDDLAVRYLPAGAQLLARACSWPPLRGLFVRLSDRRAPGVWGGLLCRKRYADDSVAAALDDGIDQVVILGAGLDTRACRLVAPRGVAAFEVDLPENVRAKEQRLRAIFGRIPEHVALVPVDFETDDLAASLGAHGFRADRPAMFVWEAVTQYLTERGVRRTLAFLARVARGSRLVFTYVRQDFLSGTELYGAPSLRRDFVVRRRLWHFGLAPEHVAALLAEYGWTEREQPGGAELARRYFEPVNRHLSVTEIERSVSADRL